jgi:hypothetical protein
MAGDRGDASAVVGTSFLVVASMWTLVVWMGISVVGLLSSLSRITAYAGVGFRRKNVFTLSCLEVLFISHEGKLDKRARHSRHIAEILGGGTTGITAKSRSSF